MNLPPFSRFGLLCFSFVALSHLNADPAPSADLGKVNKEARNFSSTPALNLSANHDFADALKLNDDPATQLKGLCSLAEFRALPQADRHIYSFELWPSDKAGLGAKSYTFNFHLGNEGVTRERILFSPSGGGPGGSYELTRSKAPDSLGNVLTGFGNLDWNGTQEHVFKFDKPVKAFGVVLRSSGDVDLKKFFWEGARDKNGFPFSYTLSDGTVVNLGERSQRGAMIAGNTNAFLGVMDKSGLGIVSVTYTIKGLAVNTAQSISMSHWAFATMPKPPVAPVANLRGSCDFESPESIAPAPSAALKELASLDDFRFIVGNHRFVYHFDSWPMKTPALGSPKGAFAFDLKGKGVVGQKVTVTTSNTSNNTSLTQVALKREDGSIYPGLGGLGDIGKGAWAEQTFHFEKPVWGFGVTYRSPNRINLAKIAGYPISYTLSDGTVVNLGERGASGGVIEANQKTFVGVMDDTDKGITSITLRVQGSAMASQPLFIEDLAFALAGPPPGDWKLTLNENFEGNKLNPAIWSTGFRFVDIINSELQGYVPENVVVENGVAKIKVENRDCHNTDRNGRKGALQKFASGAFTSYDKFTQTYGYFEARVKMPKPRGAGIWPAFWMLPDRGRDYPDSIRVDYRTKSCGMGTEIDIFEFMPFWKQLDGSFPLHVGTIWSYGKVTPQDPAPHGYGGYALDNDGWGPAEMHYPELDQKFHTYGLYWSRERLIFYIDSKPVYRVKDPKHVPDVPQYFLFNVAVGGNCWGKSADKKNPTMEQIVADMPNAMEIDYFRAYSGVLEEPIPPSPTDVPGLVKKYSPPSREAIIPAAPAPTAPANRPAEPAAPVNSTITTPSNG